MARKVTRVMKAEWDRQENEGDERYMGERCALPYCEDRPWVKLTVRGEVVRWETIRRDVEEGTTRVWRIRPDSILGETYERERDLCFCKYHATTRMGEVVPFTSYGQPPVMESSREGMATCQDCGAENVPCVDYTGGGHEDRDGGVCCGVCCDEQGVA